jgi:hypothetical protein
MKAIEVEPQICRQIRSTKEMRRKSTADSSTIRKVGNRIRILSDYWVANLSMRCFKGDEVQLQFFQSQHRISASPLHQKLAGMLAANQRNTVMPNSNACINKLWFRDAFKHSLIRSPCMRLDQQPVMDILVRRMSSYR